MTSAFGKTVSEFSLLQKLKKHYDEFNPAASCGKIIRIYFKMMLLSATVSKLGDVSTVVTCVTSSR